MKQTNTHMHTHVQGKNSRMLHRKCGNKIYREISLKITWKVLIKSGH